MEPRWLTRARSFIGTREFSGPKANSLIVRMWEAIKASIKSDEVPWCAAFVGSVLESVGIKSTRSGWARSYLKWGIPCGPRVGAIVVFSRGTFGGHVGFVVQGGENRSLLVLGGNQSDMVCIKAFSKERVLGYRWPLGESL